jgi:RNA polymerase sigma-70 factor (family 1)
MEYNVEENITKEAFDNIYRKYYSQLFYYAYGFVEDAEVCKDIVGDVFGQAWENVERLRIGTVGSYLYSSVRNRSIDYLRHSQAALQYVDYIQSVTSEEEDRHPEELEERIVAVKTILSGLPSRTRFIVEQCYFNNKKYQEVADILEVTPSAIKKQIIKALSILREKLSVIKS